jgi:hypothetical protein
MSETEYVYVPDPEEPPYDPNPAFTGQDTVNVAPFPVADPVGGPSDTPSNSLLASQWETVDVEEGSPEAEIKEEILALAEAEEEVAAEAVGEVPVEEIVAPEPAPADPEPAPVVEEPLPEPIEVPVEEPVVEEVPVEEPLPLDVPVEE